VHPDLALLAARALAGGFDLVAGFSVDAWNAAAPPGQQLTPRRERGLGAVIGNTRALWPRFTAALAEDAALLAEEAPLDRYSERVIGAAAGDAPVLFAHRPPYPPIQRIADHAGLAHLQPSHLCVHPVYGPWIAMRAVVLLDAPAPAPVAPTPPPCECARGCLPLFERAAALGFDPRHEPTWRAWVAIRDACPLGRAYRYDDDQVRYHYSVDRSALIRSLKTARG
jgi:cyanocobalamin reductase (cyanide-eliminating) / alkylcobalamin dealkylase